MLFLVLHGWCMQECQHVQCACPYIWGRATKAFQCKSLNCLQACLPFGWICGSCLSNVSGMSQESCCKSLGLFWRFARWRFVLLLAVPGLRVWTWESSVRVNSFFDCIHFFWLTNGVLLMTVFLWTSRQNEFGKTLWAYEICVHQVVQTNKKTQKLCHILGRQKVPQKLSKTVVTHVSI